MPADQLGEGLVDLRQAALCGLTEATTNYRQGHEGESPDILLVSLGTGELTRPIPYDRAKDAAVGPRTIIRAIVGSREYQSQ